jgi:hypothetical protein
MDFTEAPSWIQEAIMESIADKLGVEFDEGNPHHMELAQEAMCDDWSGN